MLSPGQIRRERARNEFELVVDAGRNAVDDTESALPAADHAEPDATISAGVVACFDSHVFPHLRDAQHLADHHIVGAGACEIVEGFLGDPEGFVGWTPAFIAL